VSLNGTNASRTTSTAINTIQFIGIAIHPTDPDTVFGGTQDNGLDRFSDSLGWSLTEGGDGGDPFYDPFNPNRMFRANPVASYGAGAFVRRSTNGGSSWSSITTGIINASAAAFYLPMVADPGTPNRLFLGTTVLNVSTNGGDSWGTLPGDTFTFPDPTRAIGIGAASPSTIYVSCGPNVPGTPTPGHATKLFVTTNNGVTWQERTPQLNCNFHNIVVDPTNSNIAYVVSANFTSTGDNVWRTTDAGLNWVSISSTLPDLPTYDLIIDPGPTSASSDDVLYVGGDFGVYRSTNLGTTWTKFGTGLPTVQVRDLEFSPTTKILAAGTHGRGVWEILTAAPTTPGFIAGAVYNDVDGDGTRDAGEPGLSGWTVFRDDNNNGVININGTSTKNSTNVPLPIPEMGVTTSTVSLGGFSGAIADINVKLNITHTFDGDMVGYLTSPGGVKVTLFNHVGGGGQNFNDTEFDDEAATLISNGSAPFAGSFQPDGLLAAFDGQSPIGTWTLTIDDQFLGDSGTLNSWSLTVTTGEPSTVTGSSGQYQFLNQPTGTYTIRRLLQPGFTATEPISGFHTAVLTPTMGAFGLNFGQTNIPAKYTSIVINNGDVQRSLVTSVKVTFNSHVNFAGSPATAFSLVNATNGNQPVTLAAAVNDAGSSTVVTLTFTGGSVDLGGSLSDGRYTFKILAGEFAGAGFDGNSNGVAGDDFTLTSSGSNGIFRLFGDGDGNATVNSTDFAMFRTFFGLGASIFDFTNDGLTNSNDFAEFRKRFGLTI
jgi:subtilisin-like proprotein convertase family protein